MAIKIHVVNFGQASGGLATVGYTVYNVAGTVRNARSTSGVVEYGTSTGIYGARITYNEFDEVIVLWDTGGANPRYAMEENRTTLAQIQDNTDIIRIIWNTLRNQGEIFKKIFDTLDAIKGLDHKDSRVEVIVESLQTLVSRETLRLEDIEKALKVTVEAPVVNYTPPAITVEAPAVNITEREVIIPDYSEMLVALGQSVKALAQEIGTIPKELKDYTKEINDILDAIGSVKGEAPLLTGAVGESIKKELQVMYDNLEMKLRDQSDKTEALDPKLEAVDNGMAGIHGAIGELKILLKLFDELNTIKPSIRALVTDMTAKNNKDRRGKFAESIGRF